MIATARALETPRNDSAPAEGGTSTGAATALARATHGPGETPRRLTATYDGPQVSGKVRELTYVQVFSGEVRVYVRNLVDSAVQSVLPSEAGDRVLMHDSRAPRAVNASHALAAAHVVLLHKHATTVPCALLEAAMDEVARLTQQLASVRIRLADATGLRDPHDPTNPPAPVAQES